MIRQDRITQTFCSLTKIDSPSFGERAMADCLTARLKRLGLTVAEDDAAEKTHGTAGNLLATLPGTQAGEPLLFAAHMDTVAPALGKKAIVHPDGTITSDGTTVLGADDVSGLAIILEALESIKENTLPHRPLEILFTIAEEPYDCGSEVFDYSKVHAKEAYVLDLGGAAGGAAYAAPTICSFTFELTGKAAHAGFAPQEGIHAVAAAALAVSKLKMGKLDEETTLNIGTIQGGTATNIVPDKCTVSGELRSYSHQTAERVLQNVIAVFQDAAKTFGASCRFSSRFGCYAYEISKNHPVVQRYAAACQATGAKLNLFRTFGGSDANQFAKHGISGLVISSAMYRCHSCEEYTTVKDLQEAAEVIQKLMTAK